VYRLRILGAIAALCIVGLLASCNRQEPGDRSGTGSSDTVAAESRPQIAVIPKGTAFTFWKAVHAGAQSAADEAGVEIIWTGPNDEGDRRQQIEVVQNFISRGVDAIVLAPADEVALARPVETAVARKIPVVIIDSNLQSDVQSSFVATDNREGGRMAARQLAQVMNEKGNVILLRFNEGSASNDQREDGFLEELAKNYPQIKVISSNQYAGTTKESAFQASQNLLNRFGEEVNGIFCPNEPVAFGMLRALETSKRAGKIKFVGFDTGESLIEGMREGSIHGLVAQDPFNMGYQGVKAAVGVLKGEPVEKRIPTRVVTITPENLDSEDIQALISPEVEASK
jgi:ribose transport system substrate-binding protein